MKYLTRPTFTPLWLVSFIAAYAENVPTVLGAGLNKHLFVSAARGVEWYVDENEFLELGNRIMAMIGKESNFAESQRKNCIATCEELLKTCQKIGREDLTSKTEVELWDLYKLYNEKFKDFVVYLAIPPPLDKFITEEVKRKIQGVLEKKGDLKSLEKCFEHITTLTESTEGMIEELELLNIAIKIEENNGALTSEVNRLIREHSSKYSWMSMYSFDGDSLASEFFLKRSMEMSNPKSLLEKKKEEMATNKLNFRNALDYLEPDEKLLNLISTLQGYIFLRTYRADMLRKAFFALLPFIVEIANRLRISRKELAYLTIAELELFLTKHVLPKYDEIPERKKHFLLLSVPGVLRIISEKEEIRRTLVEEFEDCYEKVSEVRGDGVFLGKAKGRVKIVWDVKDTDKIDEGDILVTHMTTPDMNMALPKVAAIVTDEGGITSHAAIVSRELKIPCIIGTEIATKVFKDGDLVEVNSVEGTVRKIADA